MQGINSFGKIGYTGPNPKKGKKEKYTFKFYTLYKYLDLP